MKAASVTTTVMSHGLAAGRQFLCAASAVPLI